MLRDQQPRAPTLASRNTPSSCRYSKERLQRNPPTQPPSDLLRWSRLHWRRELECHSDCRAYPGSANVKRQRQAVPPDRHARQFLNHHLCFVLPKPRNATPESSNLICCTQCLALLSSLSYLNGTTFPRNHPSVATAALDAVGFSLQASRRRLRTQHYQLHGRPRDPRPHTT